MEVRSSNQATDRRLRRRRANVFASCLCLAALAPIVQNWALRPADDFPLSYFPMFTKDRGDVVKIYHLVSVDSSGERRPVSYRLIGSGGLNQVRRQTRRIMRAGGSDELCREVAERIALSEDPLHAQIVEVHAVVADYELDAFFAGNERPTRERHRASALIPRGDAQ